MAAQTDEHVKIDDERFGNVTVIAVSDRGGYYTRLLAKLIETKGEGNLPRRATTISGHLKHLVEEEAKRQGIL